MMIYEMAVLSICSGQTETFRRAFDNVLPLLGRAPGYEGHVLARRVETPDTFNLIVRWRSLEDHTPNFESSEDHERFMAGIQGYFAAEPNVYHLEGGDFVP